MLILISGCLAVIGFVFLMASLSLAYKTHKDNGKEASRYVKMGFGGCLIFILMACSILYVVPTYMVWQKGKDGEAALAEATANRQILIQEASAKEEAAKHLAEAEITRSHGIAKANSIVSESLKGNSMYLQYLYIQSLKESQNKVIYVPITNQGLPVLESARFIDDYFTDRDQKYQEYMQQKEQEK